MKIMIGAALLSASFMANADMWDDETNGYWDTDARYTDNYLAFDEEEYVKQTLTPAEVFHIYTSMNTSEGSLYEINNTFINGGM